MTGDWRTCQNETIIKSKGFKNAAFDFGGGVSMGHLFFMLLLFIFNCGFLLLFGFYF